MTTVITYPTEEPVSLDIARRHCGIDAEGGTHPDDALLSLYISAAREWAEEYLGYRVAKTVVETTLGTFPSGALDLAVGPVLAVESLKYTDGAGAEQTVAGTVYALDRAVAPARLALKAGQVWPAGSAVRVRYTTGYSLAADSPQVIPLPRSILVAILLVVGHRWRNREDTTTEGLQAIPMGAAAQLDLLRSRLGMA